MSKSTISGASVLLTPRPQPGTRIVFSGTVLELSIKNSQERDAHQSSFADYPSYIMPIDKLVVGDTALYDRAKSGEVATYEIEEIHEHGADSNQRIIVARKVFPANEKPGIRMIFNARFLLGSKSLDLYNPTKTDVINIESCVATRQDLNKRGGYK